MKKYQDRLLSHASTHRHPPPTSLHEDVLSHHYIASHRITSHRIALHRIAQLIPSLKSHHTSQA
ncbi:hypothetical protein E2C01_095944 [Portunus trituberculatus]|uniref:Uncharacterized protein n=1 Tax=Portunus trituberculatus TaxID=210409 RepID=A0A5B7JUC2_PORTR|nr:hypothetical protein [Portunus trituberculatus]